MDQMAGLQKILTTITTIREPTVRLLVSLMPMIGVGQAMPIAQPRLIVVLRAHFGPVKEANNERPCI